MMAMARSVVTLLISVVFFWCTSVQSISWNGLQVRYSPTGQDNGYYSLPRTAAEARKNKWLSPPELMLMGGMYNILCPDRDPTVCIIYDRMSGHVNGIEISYLREDLKSTPYDYNKRPMFQKGRRFGYQVYTVRIYTVKPGSSSTKGPNGIVETGNGAWMEYGPQGVPLFEIPRLTAGMKDTLFKLQSCVPGMGDHYYYNVSKSLACEDWEPMAALYSKGEMIGVTMQIFGKKRKIRSQEWFESIPDSQIKKTIQGIIPDAPICLNDWAVESGFILLHMYFVEEAWKISCP